MSKSLGNTDTNPAGVNVLDMVTFGRDQFKLLSKASSQSEGWMKSTKAMEIPGVGCVVQVTTQQGDNVAEALTFIPGVKIHILRGYKDNAPILYGRRLVPLTFVPNVHTPHTCENGCCLATKANPFGDCENRRYIDKE
ncbi:MAG: hypothetical protein DRH97_03815 [Chloroflexi bacterium]|nr:MAG: hypothetical protein DRH97_03815 [Chloroflexota bacterium]